MKLRKKQYTLPPGHLGWPLIGNMLAFVKDFKSGHPDSFINNLISRSLLLFLPWQYFFKHRHTHMHKYNGNGFGAVRFDTVYFNKYYWIYFYDEMLI
jgi:hypothetical protein